MTSVAPADVGDDQGLAHPERLGHHLTEGFLQRRLHHCVHRGHQRHRVTPPPEETDPVPEPSRLDLTLQRCPFRSLADHQQDDIGVARAHLGHRPDQEPLALLLVQPAEVPDREAPRQAELLADALHVRWPGATYFSATNPYGTQSTFPGGTFCHLETISAT